MNSRRSKICGVMVACFVSAILLGSVAQLAHAQESVLYSFGSPGDGYYPRASLIMDTKGDLYSTTNQGGADGVGTVFELSPEPPGGCAAGTNSGDGWCESLLYSFGSASGDGTYPDDALILHKGRLYGATYSGGIVGPDCSYLGCGTVFELSRKPKSGCATGTNPGDGWCETVLYAFGSESADGFGVQAGLIMDKEGNLYGTTLYGGNGIGTVFELSPEPAGGCPAGSYPGNGWCEIVLYAFGNEPDGQNPSAGVIMDKHGNLYGTTENGGTNQGTVFKLSPEPPGGCAAGTNRGNGWCETVLYSFGSQSGDGATPYAGLVVDSKGNLYGSTTRGGDYTWGTVFEVTPAGEETTLYSFGTPPLGEDDGCGSMGTLIRDSKGNLYGTTNACGSRDGGTVFEVSPPAKKGGTWTETILYDFNGVTGGDASAPQAGLIMDKQGNLYGTTDLGGVNGNGAVFEVTP